MMGRGLGPGLPFAVMATGGACNPALDAILALSPDIFLVTGCQGTTYITGDPCSAMEDVSGNDRDGAQASYGPNVENDGDIYYLDFHTGNSDTSIEFTTDWIKGQSACTWVVAAKCTGESGPDGQHLVTSMGDYGFDAGHIYAATNWWSYYENPLDEGKAQYGDPDSDFHVHVSVFDGSLSGDSNRMKVWLDGEAQECTYSRTVPATLSNYLGALMGLCQSDSSDGSFGVYLYIGWSSALTAGQVATVTSAVNTLCGEA